MKRKIGRARSDLYDWLTGTWLDDGPPVCFLQGFPGIGKSELARDVRTFAQQRHIPSAIAEVTSSTMTLNDLLFALSGQLAVDGSSALADAISSGSDLLAATEIILKGRILLIIDEAQALFERGTGKPGVELNKLLVRLKNQPAFGGRVLIIIDRRFDDPDWAEVFEVRELHKLDLKEAVVLLDTLLISAGRDADVPSNRRRSIVVALDGNPRALQSFVGCLAFDSVDNILGEDPGLWALGDRTIAARLVQQLESRLLEKTLTHLDDRTRNFLQSLSVHRVKFQRSAMEKLARAEELEKLVENLIYRFVLVQHSGSYSLNPIAREISHVRLRAKPATLKSAHSVAADYQLGPFKAREMTGDVSSLAPRFAELRYHLANAARSEELRPVVQRFTSYLRSQFHFAGITPTDRETVDEHIAVLSVVLEDPGPASLEFYLARLLNGRRGPRDNEAALKHARRAAGPSSHVANWLLVIQLEREVNGFEAARDALKEAFRILPDPDSQPDLYVKGAELYAEEGRPEEAISLLEQGLLYVPKGAGRTPLYRRCAEQIANVRGDAAAITFLQDRALKETLPEQNAFTLYEFLAELYVAAGNVSMALSRLREGFDIIPENKGVHSLYQIAAKILARGGDTEGALSIFEQARKRMTDAQTKAYFLEAAMVSCVATNNRKGLEKLLSDESVGEAQLIYGRALLAIIDDNWAAANTELRKEVRVTHGTKTLVALRALCALVTESPESAAQILRRIDVTPSTKGFEPIHWLEALIAIRLGDNESAAESIRSLLRRPLMAADEISLDFLLNYWDESQSGLHGVSTAFHFPKLPPIITGLSKSVTRPPFGPPVLPAVQKVLSASENDREEAKTGPLALCVATEWHSAHGGLSTFNRELAEALARSGSLVYCYIPDIRPGELAAAAAAGVHLIESPDRSSATNAVKLRRRPPLPENYIPDIIIGHDRITGAEAEALRDDFFPNCKTVLFIHTAPREIEWYKMPDADETSTAAAESRARLQKQLALRADLVAAVGPRLFAAIQTALVGETPEPTITRIDPGMRISTENLVEPQLINCLLLGRAEDHSLKGLDIAARALGILRGRFQMADGRHANLIIRGATAASGDSLKRELAEISGNSQLFIDVRPFIADADEVRAEIRSAWIVLMPSRAEGFGLVALEAVGQGIPVLVGEESGLAALLRSQCPHLSSNVCIPYIGVLERDAAEWAARIEFVLRDRPAAIARAAELREQLATNLTWDRAAAEMFAGLTIRKER
jgi:glycosyltransferase involved in cell wall biosynthesis/tetratricopeptide (TPR) repeat protein